jgi:hypothetical protein
MNQKVARGSEENQSKSLHSLEEVVVSGKLMMSVKGC